MGSSSAVQNIIIGPRMYPLVGRESMQLAVFLTRAFTVINRAKYPFSLSERGYLYQPAVNWLSILIVEMRFGRIITLITRCFGHVGTQVLLGHPECCHPGQEKQ